MKINNIKKFLPLIIIVLLLIGLLVALKLAGQKQDVRKKAYYKEGIALGIAPKGSQTGDWTVGTEYSLGLSISPLAEKIAMINAELRYDAEFISIKTDASNVPIVEILQPKYNNFLTVPVIVDDIDASKTLPKKLKFTVFNPSADPNDFLSGVFMLAGVYFTASKPTTATTVNFNAPKLVGLTFHAQDAAPDTLLSVNTSSWTVTIITASGATATPTPGLDPAFQACVPLANWDNCNQYCASLGKRCSGAGEAPEQKVLYYQDSSCSGGVSTCSTYSDCCTAWSLPGATSVRCACLDGSAVNTPTPTITIMPTATVTSTPGPSTTPIPGAPKLKFKVKIPDISSSKTSLGGEDTKIYVYDATSQALLTTAFTPLTRVDDTNYFESSEFSINVPANTYAIGIKNKTTLRRIFTGVTLTMSQTLICTGDSGPDCGTLITERENKPLLSGDSDGFADGAGHDSFNATDMLDVQKYVNNNLSADFNLDGSVELLDLSILAGNFGKTGENYP